MEKWFTVDRLSKMFFLRGREKHRAMDRFVHHPEHRWRWR